jgi:hypothetical protein
MTGRARSRSRAIRQTSAALPLLLLPPAAFGILPLIMPFEAVVEHHVGDLFLYQRIADAILGGGLPYRDVPIEYPPLSIAAFLSPLLPSLRAGMGFEPYAWGFAATTGVLATVCGLTLAGTALAWRPMRGIGSVLGSFALILLLAMPIAPWRYDLLPAALSVIAVGLAVSDRPGPAGVAIGLGIGAKLYPAVFAPILALGWLAAGRRDAAARFTVAAAITMAAVFLPFVAIDPGSSLSFLSFHQERGLQLESTWAGVIGALHVIGLTEASVGVGFGGQQIDGPLVPALLAVQPAILVVGLVAVTLAAGLRFRQESRALGGVRHETLVAYAVIGLVAFMALNKVLSPQYLVWLVPLAPLLRPAHALAVALIVATTLLVFPGPFMQPLTVLDPLAILALNVRNALLVGVGAWLLAAYRPGRLDERPPAARQPLEPRLSSNR